HTGLRVRFRRGSYIVSVKTADGVDQRVGHELGPLRFADRAKDAPIVHLAGPLTFLLRRGSLELVPGKDVAFIALVGTAGLGAGAAVYCHTKELETARLV